MAGVKSSLQEGSGEESQSYPRDGYRTTEGESQFCAHGTSMSVWNFKQEEIIFKLCCSRKSHVVLATKAVEVR